MLICCLDLGKAVQFPDFASQMQAKTAVFRAYRSFYVASSYRRLGKQIEATALYRNCVLLCKASLSTLSNLPALEQVFLIDRQRNVI